MAIEQWAGVMPALMTEMRSDGSLDMDATAAHIEAMLEAGIHGLIILGTLGENPSLSVTEKRQVMECAVATAKKRVPVICGVADYSQTFALHTMRDAEAAGCDGLMILPSMVYHQDSREALAHFGFLAKSTDLPIMIYNNPVAYNTDLSPEDFLQLAEFDNIVAVKESSHDSRRITDMFNACGDRYLLFCGVDDRALENFACGAVGWVSGMTNAFPAETVKLYDLIKAGQMESALALYRWMMPILHLDCAVKLVQYIKLANQMTGMGAEWVRAPRLTLEGDERDRVAGLVQAAIDTRPILADL